MLKNSYFFGFLLLFFCLLTISHAANCTFKIQKSITYLTTPDTGFSRSILFYMSSLKDPTVYIGYSFGNFEVRTYRRSPKVVEKYLYAKDFKTTFSDRTWCPNQATGLCIGYQTFDYRRTDLAQLSLYLNSTGKIVFTAWNNATYSFTL